MQYAGFRPVRTESGKPLPEIQWWVIMNSVTISLGDAIKITPEQGADPADAVTDVVYGYAVAFKCSNGLPLELATSGTDYDGTWTASTYTYAADSDNETVKKVMVAVMPANGVICSCLLDAAQATTTGSNKVGCYVDVLTTDSRKLDESTASTTLGNYMLIPGRSASDPTDPNDPTTTRVMCKAIELQTD